MQIRGQFSDFFFQTMLPALNAKIWPNFRNKPHVYKRVMRTETTNRSIEQYVVMAGVGLPEFVPEGADTPTDTFVQGPYQNFIPAKYGLGINASAELVEDDKMGVISRRAVALSNAIYQNREIQAASVYNNAFDTTGAYYGPDGVSLCNSSHPLYKAGGVQNNALAVAADLDVASLEMAMTDWELTKSHEGFLQLLPTPRLLVASANRVNAYEILKSEKRADTANNAINALNYTENGGAIEPIVWPFLTDPDGWFLVAPPEDTNILWLDRKAPYTKSEYTEKNETGTVYMRYRATVGFYDFHGVYGTPGA